MHLSSESNRKRWGILVATWMVLGALLFSHTALVGRYLDLVANLGLRGQPAATTPLVAAYPAFAADAQTWVRHALSLLEGEQVRLRKTNIDDAPAGREVHWNSAWAWTIAGAGYLEHRVSGAPLPQAVERAALWLPSVVIACLIVLLSAMVARRAGAAAGVFLAVAVLGHQRIYEGFFPRYVDHHGLLTVSVLGLVLGAVFMGVGWRALGEGDGVSPADIESSRRWAIFSALSGAAGIWVSAASAIPPVAIVGVAGLATIFICGRQGAGGERVFDGGIWRLWGNVGAGASFAFYLVEYFPSHVGLRLESNHPLYSLAWLAAAHLIASLGEWWVAGGDWRRLPWRRISPAIAAAMLVPATVLLGRERVFVVLDPFLGKLHNSIQEFQPLWRSLPQATWTELVTSLFMENIPMLAGVATLGLVRVARVPVLWFAMIAAVLFTTLGWAQMRWLLNASGAHVVLVLTLVAVFVRRLTPRGAWLAVGVVMGALYLPFPIIRIIGANGDVTARRVGPKDAQLALARDIAAVIRASAPGEEVVLLTNPNSSTAIGYYGRFKTLGTLYWENVGGLKSAAAIFSASSEEEAMRLVRQHGVTHIAMISEENFLEPYFRLWRPSASMDEFKKSFGYQLLADKSVPAWLRMLPYKAPDDLTALKITVLLFKVNFDQSPADALYHIALAKVAAGDLTAAEQDFDTLIKGSPESFQPWLRKGELLFGRRDFAGALAAFQGGLAKAPAGERIGLYAGYAGNFFREKQYAQAVALYRAALSGGFEPTLATYLAFALATASDDSVRNSSEAINLSTKILQVSPGSPLALNALAAALADDGRFEEAVVAAERALKTARERGDAALVRVTEERVALFRQRKPLRQ